MAEQVEKALTYIKTLPTAATLQATGPDAAGVAKNCTSCGSLEGDDSPSCSRSGSGSTLKLKGPKSKTRTCSVDANVVAAAEAVVNGELDAASCYHVSMKMSIDAATPRICGDTIPLKCDALAAMREALSANKSLPVQSKLTGKSSGKSNKSEPPSPCQLLERLNFPEGNIINTLHTILALPPFDPYAPAPKSDMIYKEVVSLIQWSLREGNAMDMELSDNLIQECKSKSKDLNDETRSYLMAIENMRLFSEDPKNPLRDADGQLRAITVCWNCHETDMLKPNPLQLYFQNLALIYVKHRKEEFFTFCSCKECLEYRETIMAIMMDQFKAAHMVVMLLDVLIKAYSPMLKNDAAYNKFEKLLESNKQIYWITSGFLYDKKAEYLDFIDDTAISDNMILVLFSAILMANNPMLLLQILAYNVECIVKAFSEGMIEIAQNVQENEKISAEKMLTYLLDGYSDLNCISQNISLNLFAFENDFLRKFKLSWVLLCQRLFQQHVFNPLGDTMLACMLSLKEGEGSTQATALIKRYMLFDEHMHSIERRWTDIWMELNKFNLSSTEHGRRKGLLDVYNIFDKVVMDATSFPLPDISDDEFIDFQRIVDRQLAWKNIMAFTKLKWPDGFYDPPNKLVYEDLCKKCNAMLEYHKENCKCITCSIAGTPLMPRQAGNCAKCTTLGIVEKDAKLMKSKILSTCTSDETKLHVAASTSAAAVAAGVAGSQKRQPETVTAAIKGGDESSGVALRRQDMDTSLRTTYHIAWAVFQHLATRKRYRYDSIEPQYFCGENCRVSACQLARKILANELSPPLTKHLLRCFQPLSFSREELRTTLPSLMFFNRKLAPSPAELQELKNQHYVYKTYWTFVLSIYANFFVKFNSSATNFKHLELQKGDLRLRPNSVVGDRDDGRFEQFLAQVIGYSPFKTTDDFTLGDANIEKMQFGVDHLMKLHDSQMVKRGKPDSTTNMAAGKAKTNETTAAGNDSNNSKKSKEKMRKCCADYADIGETCKENHSKKRVKKECNHARFNETRDRLRKKLTQSKSKNVQEAASSTSSSVAVPVPTVKGPIPKALAERTIGKKLDTVTTQVPSSQVQAATRKVPTAAAAAAAADATAALSEISDTIDDGDNSLLCLDSLCKSIQMNTDGMGGATSGSGTSSAGSLPPDLSNYSKEEIMHDFVEFLGNYTCEQDQKRWINETLNFIEGKPQQPQTTNPKKAAKKAKQKQRKEEEKRIRELEDLRSQFLDIYFKEFIDKYEMRTLTAAGGRKREKKRISELEANIKNLQRAKAKVESVILELIATVKQSNHEFKFSYLPTKEQQLAKLAQLDEILKGGLGLPPLEALHPPPAPAPAAPPAAGNAHYPNFISSAAFFPPHIAAAHTPMCYAPPQPPQQQQLPRDVIAAMASNAITADPSKRIVTIRRVQLPNAGGEQQVTVVAKGSSPDEDKLLYTFVNGHMVASTQTTTKNVAPVAPAETLVPEKSAKAKKKEAKRAAAAANAAAAAAAAAATAADLQTKAKKKKQNKKASKAQPLIASSSSSDSSSKSQTPLSSNMNTRENSTCSNKPKVAVSKKANKKKIAAAPTPKPLPVEPKPVPEPEPSPEPEPVKRHKRLKPRHDEVHLENNPFKFLHVQDSSDGEWETGSESDEYVKPQVVNVKPQPKAIVTSKPVAPMPNAKQKPVATAVPNKKSKNESMAPPRAQVPQQPSKTAPSSSSNSRKGTERKQPQPPPAQPKSQLQCSSESHTSNSTRKSKSQISIGQATNGLRMSQSRGGRVSGRTKSTNDNQQQPHANSTSTSSSNAAETSGLTSKRSQRGKRGHRGQKQEDLSGIPNNMGYFNPNEVAIPPPVPPHSGSYASTLAQQMQHLRIGGNTAVNQQQHQQQPNCSIMDQLNRGVQVEHLSLPPGITLTKVDPAKSEQLRQKSESIRKLSKPLAEQQQQHHLVQQQQQAHLMSSYYSGNTTGIDNAGGVIMVEANPRSNARSSQSIAMPSNGGGNGNVAAAAAAASASGKSSRRRRRNRGKSSGSGAGSSTANLTNKQRSGPDKQQASHALNGAPIIKTSSGGKIITLRNPLFHQGLSNGPVPPTSTLSNSNPVPPARVYGGGLPIAAPMPVDQPAAIIKNENGMFTIRNPALHQAVTNGLAMGGYRQFGSNVNYYTPQEAVAEAARATQQKLSSPPLVVTPGVSSSNSSCSNAAVSVPAASTNFSYFSSGSASGGSSNSSSGSGVGGGCGGGMVDTHNNISISCTNVSMASPGRLVGDAAVIARPKQTQKCLSAIGSELKQKTKDNHSSVPSQWSGFGQPTPPEFGAGPTGSVLQEKYQQSSYYNGFEVFSSSVPSTAGGPGASGDGHMHHNCGDDSPPPTITGFNSYLEGIPNTGVIRYDDAAFLKNLIPGQHLNNEVSIHNISESNFTRNNTSPSPHHVEITTVFGSRNCSANAYDQQQQQQQQQQKQSQANSYCENVAADYGSDSSHLFVLPRLSQSTPSTQDPFVYDFDGTAAGSKPASVGSDLSEFLRRSPHSQRTSPYSPDENVALETFVQNMNALQIASEAEQCARLNGSGTSVADAAVTDATASSGVGATWW